MEAVLPTLTLPPPSLSPVSEQTLCQSTVSKKRKGSSYKHVVPVEKKIKRMGRPKNGWTPTRKRKLIRLYLMTDLDVVDIAQVLRREHFQPWSALRFLWILRFADVRPVNETFKSSSRSYFKIARTRSDLEDLSRKQDFDSCENVRICDWEVGWRGHWTQNQNPIQFIREVLQKERWQHRIISIWRHQMDSHYLMTRT